MLIGNKSIMFASFSQSRRLFKMAERSLNGYAPLRRMTTFDYRTYVEQLIDLPSDIVVHLDEDCFVCDKQGLDALLRHFVQQGYAAAGTPDGGNIVHRVYNPIALNPFFLVLNASELRALRSQGSQIWETQLDPIWQSMIPHDLMKPGNEWHFRDHEPYYPFFYWIHHNRRKVLFLDTNQSNMDSDGWTTIVKNHQGTRYSDAHLVFEGILREAAPVAIRVAEVR